MTYEEQKNYFQKILEFAKIFNCTKTDLNKNKKETEEKARNDHE